jgi:outer membrane murein-binding lipoprotein Lpp
MLGVSASALAQETHLLVITGISGDEEHAKAFHQLATRFIDAAKKKDAVPDANVTYLAEKTELDPARISGPSTKAGIEQAFGDLAAKVHPNDEIFVLLIGHGGFDGRTATFNMPGPDFNAADFARLLGKFATERVVFVDTTSSSGGFLQALAAPGRTIVTATKTGGEKLEPRFAQFFVDAYDNEAADRDRNGRISVAEAFEYAKAQVAGAYQKAGTIQTEHAALDDGSEGKLAATLYLSTGGRVSAKLDMNDSQVRELVKERDALEQQVAALKLRKTSMDAAQYDQELEKLLVALAQKTKALQQLEVKKQ